MDNQEENKTKKCLYCYLPLIKNELDYHSNCVKMIFGSKLIPKIDFKLNDLKELAKQIVIKSVAVTGVQPKLSLELEKYNKEASRLTIVGLQGNYILKPPSLEYNELPENEDLTMHLANLAKIKTATHCLIKLSSGELAYLTKRFDRNKKEKIAVEDFCQLSESLTEHKYRSSIEKVGKITQKFTTNKGFEMQRLFELVLFCYFTGNADMHLKNFALIQNNRGEFELSPAYDLVNTTLVIKDDKEESALTINGKKNRLYKKDFDTLASNMKINANAMQNIYNKFEKILPIWFDFISISFLSKKAKDDYKALIQLRHNNIFKNQ